MSGGPLMVLLTWNPGRVNDRRWTPTQWYAEMVTPHARGETVTTSWGVGRHVNGFAVGRPVVLYRQGAWGRGLVARGVLASEPRPDPERTRNIVDVEWGESVPIDDALEVAELERAAPSFPWRQVWSSGRHLPEDVTSAVLRAWAERLEDVRRGSAGECGMRSAGCAP